MTTMIKREKGGKSAVNDGRCGAKDDDKNDHDENDDNDPEKLAV